MDLRATLEDVKKLEKQGNSTEFFCNEEDDGNFTSPFASMYKCRPFDSQEKRRENLLVSLKLRRSQMVDEKRALDDLFDVDDVEMQEETSPEPMEVTTSIRKRRRKKQLKFGNALMMSEWFSEVPLDLEKDWLVKLCPVGVRNLIVAHNGITRSFNRRGKLLASHTSHLPGGGPSTPFHKFTVLDCIFAFDCYHVLDVLAWNSFFLKQTNTDMRFYWLKSKLAETPELQQRSHINPFVFYEIDYFPAELPLIEEKLSHSCTFTNIELHLDGVLFYHKDTTYLKGLVPLVGWLKPYMIPEMLHVPVHGDFLKKVPNGYTSLTNYLEMKNRKKKKT